MKNVMFLVKPTLQNTSLSLETFSNAKLFLQSAIRFLGPIGTSFSSFSFGLTEKNGILIEKKEKSPKLWKIRFDPNSGLDTKSWNEK